MCPVSNGPLARSGVPRRHRDRAEVEENLAWVAKWGELRMRLGSGMLVALVGERGTGKTQLAVELIREVCEMQVDDWNHPENIEPKYVKAIDLFLRLRAGMRDESMESEVSLLKRYSRASLLVIDEIQERGETAWEDRVLHHLIDSRYGAMLDTVLIGNFKPEELVKSLGPSVASRLVEAGGVVVCDWSSFRTPTGASPT